MPSIARIRPIFFLTACSTTSVVTSIEVDRAHPPSVTAGSGIYGVGRSAIEVTLSRPDDAKGDASAPAGGSESKPTTDAPDADQKKKATDGKAGAAAAADGSEDNASPEKPPKAGPAKGDQAATVAGTQPATCKDLRTEYRTDRFAYLRFKAKTDALLAIVGGYIADDGHSAPVSDAQLVPILTGLKDFLKDSPAAFQLAEVANNSIALVESECPTPIKVDLKHVVDADPARIFQLVVNTNDFSSDEFTFKTDGSGLPVLVETSADDQTGAILTSLATSIGTIVGLMKPLPVPLPSSAGLGKDGSGPKPFAPLRQTRFANYRHGACESDAR